VFFIGQPSRSRRDRARAGDSWAATLARFNQTPLSETADYLRRHYTLTWVGNLEMRRLIDLGDQPLRVSGPVQHSPVPEPPRVSNGLPR